MCPRTRQLSFLSLADTTKLQVIVGILLHYACAIDDKTLVALGSISTQTYATKKKTFSLITHLLNYVSTHPNDSMTYRKSHMQLTTHSDAGHLNQSKAKNRTSTHICLSEDVPMPTFNGAVLKIVQIIKCVMSSAAEAELASFLMKARKCVALRQTLNEMR